MSTLGMLLMLGGFLQVPTEIMFEPNLEFYLSLIGLAIGALGGLYLLAEYFRHGRSSRFLLFWLIGMTLIYWFRVPMILANTGSQFVLRNFDFFLAVSFPVSLAGFILMLWGTQSAYRSIGA